MSSPNTFESVAPCSGSYSFLKDLRLNSWLLVATAVYLAQRHLIGIHPEWSPAARGFASLAPLAPALLYVRSWVRFVRGMDELQRRVQIGAHLFAAWGTILAGIVFTTLNEQGVIAFLPHGPGFGGVMVCLLFLWSIGVAVGNCRYK
jgi:hypothetical protein